MISGKRIAGALALAIALGGVGIFARLTLVPSLPARPPATSEQRAHSEGQRRAELDRTVYALEEDAQRHEEWFYQRWDAARRGQHRPETWADLGFSSMRVGKPGPLVAHDSGVTVTHWQAGPQDAALDQAAWRALAQRWLDDGFQVTASEWHQPKFEHAVGAPAHSTTSLLIQAVNARDGRRQVIRGTVDVLWDEGGGTPGATPHPDRISVIGLDVVERRGEPAFALVPGPGGAGRTFGPERATDLVLAYDLDRDGLPDLLEPGVNALLRNRGGMAFDREPLCANGLEAQAGVIGDFTGDGLPDLLCIQHGTLLLAAGIPGGHFAPAVPAGTLPEIDLPQVMTCGDIDGDGHLDVLVAQYLPPYAHGQMPTPYYDANDGPPLFLLHNRGDGHFDDITAGSGVEAKRNRRVFAASLVDLDEDGRLDLLLTSDFAGTDIFLGDGLGHFRDATADLIDQPHSFGMSHTIADFDSDGHLDLYVTGMGSTTARRLEAMHAGVPGFDEHQRMRPAMGYGNRMFLGHGHGKPFTQPPWQDQINRTGWSWGATSPDFDNDGDRDLFVANGFVSAESCRDYCTGFWRHDIYAGSSRADSGLKLFFDRDLPDFSQVSWNGYEHKVLLLDETAADGARRFLNIAHLMDVACEYDARAVIGCDLDGDGKVDLAVMEKHFATDRRWLNLYRNRWPDAGHWIALYLDESAGGAPVPGSLVTVSAGGRTQISTVITGDSFMCQHPSAVHFGIGAATAVDWIEVRWADGQVTRVEKPEADHAHRVSAPAFTVPGQRP
ncbi:MAG: CRTAC1 family protein [Planctomycetes bacterium]|nr:CRTAC1 family protein [Planctomycetota bacterium]